MKPSPRWREQLGHCSLRSSLLLFAAATPLCEILRVVGTVCLLAVLTGFPLRHAEGREEHKAKAPTGSAAALPSSSAIGKGTARKSEAWPREADPRETSTKPPADPARPLSAHIVESYGRLPLSFEANHGQTDPAVKFLSRGSGYTLFLTPNEAVLTLKRGRPGPTGLSDPFSAAPQAIEKMRSGVVRLKLMGVNPSAQVVGMDELPGKSNYFIGNDPSKWRTDVSTYARVKYEGVYPGVDLIYYGNQRMLEYDFIVAPGADPKAIALEVQGARKTKLDAAGNLLLEMSSGDVELHKPVVYQEVAGAREEIVGRYVLRGKHRVSFEVARYDASKPLIIDPSLAYSSYLGGNGGDVEVGIALDSAGNAYVGGTTASTNFPTTAGALQTSFGGGASDIFVTKLNPTGSALVYSTYLGGSFGDAGGSIAVDSSGNAYIGGSSASPNFPTTPGAFMTTCTGNSGAIVTKLNPTGSSLVYSTYVACGAGGGQSLGPPITIDSSGNVYAALTGAVLKLNSTGTALVYSISIAGGFFNGIAVDSSGNAYVTGLTNSASYPTTPGAFQTTFPTTGAGNSAVVVTKINATGTALVYSTFLDGTNANDSGNGIAVDASGNAYVTGVTGTPSFPTTPGSFQPTFAGGRSDAFITKLNASGSALVYSTFLGGSGAAQFGIDGGNGIAVDAAGNAFVTGATSSTNFPTRSPIQAALGGSSGNPDAFIAKLDPTGSTLLFSTYLGGSLNDSGGHIAIDTLGGVYVSGGTSSTDFPTTAGAFQTTFAGGGFLLAVGGTVGDAFVAKISFVVDLSITKMASPNPVNAGATLTYTLNVSNAGPGAASGVTVTDTLPAGVSFVSASGTGWTCTQSAGTVTCTMASLAVGAAPAITVTVTAPSAGGMIVNTATASASETDPTPADNTASANTTVTPVADLSITKTGSPNPVNPSAPLTYTLNVSNAGPSPATLVRVTDTLPAGVIFGTATGTGWTCSQASGVVTCTMPNLAVGAAPAITITVTTPSTGGSITNTASVTATETDPNPANNTASVSTTVTPLADLSVTKSAAPNPVIAGTNLTYTVGVSNAGPSPATSVSVKDTLSAGVTFVSASGTGWTCSQAAGVVTCTMPSLAVGAAPNITIVVTVSPSARGTIINTVNVSATETDPNTANNTATQSTTVNAQADISITKTASPNPVNAGATLTYTLSISNAGPSDATSVSVTDNLPGGVTFGTATGTGWTCSQASGVVTCTRAAIAAGATAPAITITVTAPAAGGTIINNAAVTATETDPNLANNSATASTTVTPVADLSITKTANPSPVLVGGTLTYTLNVSNAGPSVATSVVVTDTLPAGVTFGSVSGSGWTCGNAGLTVTCTLASLAPGAAPAITISVTVPTTPGNISNTASVSSAITDPNPANNSATTNTAVNPLIPPDFSLNASPASAAIPKGLATVYALTVTPSGGFNQAVALSCSTDAELASCTPAPSSVTLDGRNSSNATITVTTTLGTAAPPWGRSGRRPLPFGPPAALQWLFVLLTLAMIAALLKTERRWTWSRVTGFAAVIAFCGLLLAGCASRGPGTPRGTHIVTITGTSGGTTHSTTVVLIVR